MVKTIKSTQKLRRFDINKNNNGNNGILHNPENKAIAASLRSIPTGEHQSR